MRPARISLVSIGLAALSAALLFFFLARGATPEKGTPPKRNTAEESPGGKKQSLADPSLRIRWIPGDTLQYDLQIRTNITFSADAEKASPAEGARNTEQTVSGRLNMRIFEFDGTSAQVGLQLAPVAVTGDLWKQEEAEHLSVLFSVRFAAHGMIEEFTFPKGFPEAHRKQLAELIRIFQFVVPVSGENTWTAYETHTSGRYSARYRRTETGGIIKNKTRYLLSDAASDDDALNCPVKVLHSLVSIRLSGGHSWCRRVAVEDKLNIQLNKGLHLVSSVNASVEEHQGGAEISSVALFDPGLTLNGLNTMLEGEGRKSLHAAPPESVSAYKQRNTRFLPLTPEMEDAAHKLLDGIDASSGSRTRQLVSELADLLRRCPELVERIPGYMRQASFKDRTLSELFLALEKAGTAQAQEALCSILDDDTFRAMNRLRAIVALGGTARPTSATISALWNTFHRRVNREEIERSNTAVLALGSVARTLRHSDDARYPEVQSRITGELNTSGDRHKTVVLIKSLGNMADPAVLPDVAPYLDAEAGLVRAAAAKTMAYGGTSDVPDILSSHLEDEPNSAVRAALATSLGRQKELSREANDRLKPLIKQEPDPRVRLAMAQCLATHADMHPENLGVLEHLLRTDRSRHIRNWIAQALMDMQEK